MVIARPCDIVHLSLTHIGITTRRRMEHAGAPLPIRLLASMVLPHRQIIPEAVEVGDVKFGELVQRWSELSSRLWMLPCAFAQSDLTRAAAYLVRGGVYIPGLGLRAAVRLRRLGELGVLGPDRRDVYDAFSLSNAPSAYPAFWGHDASAVLTMAQASNRYL